MLKKYNIKKYITFAPCFGAEPSVMEVMLNRESGVNPGLYPQLSVPVQGVLYFKCHWL